MNRTTTLKRGASVLTTIGAFSALAYAILSGAAMKLASALYILTSHINWELFIMAVGILVVTTSVTLLFLVVILLMGGELFYYILGAGNLELKERINMSLTIVLCASALYYGWFETSVPEKWQQSITVLGTVLGL